MSEVRRLWIPGEAGPLEACVRVARSPRATCAIGHPHPLYGGTMHHPVIFHTDRELNRAGLTTLRFNFRGAGESGGRHDDGRGEVDDVESALDWVRGLAPDVPQLYVGFSFGAWCGLRLLGRRKSIVSAMVAIGLPVRVYDASNLGEIRAPVGAVHASEDEFGSPDEVRAFLDRLPRPGPLHVVEDTPHLFPRRAREAARGVVDVAHRLLFGS